MRALTVAAATVLVAVALLAQASGHLLGFGPPRHGDVPIGSGGLAGPGPHPVGVRELDEGTVWYPAAESVGGRVSYAYALNVAGPDGRVALATFEGIARRGAAPDWSAAPYPTVLLSHGYAIPASAYAWLGEHLASHGFTVVAPDHGESLDPASMWRSTVERPQDLADVFGRLGALAGLVDMGRVAAVGHSYGGYAALAAGGARIDTAGFARACAVDDRVAFLCHALMPRWGDIATAAGFEAVPPGVWPTTWSVTGVEAVVSMAGDAAMFAGGGLEGLTVPVMAIGGTADVDSPFESGTQWVFETAPAERRAEVALEGAGHLVFAGPCERARRIVGLFPLGLCDDPGWDRGEARSVAKHYVTAFLLVELAGQGEHAVHLAPGHRQPARVGYRSAGY